MSQIPKANIVLFSNGSGERLHTYLAITTGTLQA
jgi:hypothetical protein